MPPQDQPLTTLDKFVAYALIAALIALEILGVRMNHGHPPRQVWALMQAGLVLILSLAFYLLTRGSKGELKKADLGIRLGGPAAIGIVIVIVLNGLIPWEQGGNVRILDVPGLSPNDVVQVYKQESVDCQILGDQRVLVEFRDGEATGRIALRKPDAQATSWRYTRYDFSRSGEVETAEVKQEEVDSW